LFHNRIKEGTKTWCDWGPWNYSRHPNYFAEILFWWAIFISATQAFAQNDPSIANSGYFIIVGPIFISTLLLSLSGIPILEKNANMKFHSDPAYLNYREKTSPLILLPTTLYAKIPMVVKRKFYFFFHPFVYCLHSLIQM
jgi:steroid 5-alpha reductase family enzyme